MKKIIINYTGMFLSGVFFVIAATTYYSYYKLYNDFNYTKNNNFLIHYDYFYEYGDTLMVVRDKYDGVIIEKIKH